ncbi:MAG: SBBP repeat-containing protein [Bryobacteraceae bacterium]
MRFALGAYDRRRRLVVDPSLVYSTYLGASSFNYGQAVAVDSQGNAFVTSFTVSPWIFPP